MPPPFSSCSALAFFWPGNRTGWGPQRCNGAGAFTWPCATLAKRWGLEAFRSAVPHMAWVLQAEDLFGPEYGFLDMLYVLSEDACANFEVKVISSRHWWNSWRIFIRFREFRSLCLAGHTYGIFLSILSFSDVCRQALRQLMETATPEGYVS